MMQSQETAPSLPNAARASIFVLKCLSINCRTGLAGHPPPSQTITCQSIGQTSPFEFA